MSRNFEIVLDDLWEDTPEYVDLYPLPDMTNMDIHMKTCALLRLIKRALRMKSRRLAFLNAYYLGEMIEKDDVFRYTAKQILSPYYFIATVRTYYIFEHCPEQIMRTKSTTLKIIRDLKSHKFGNLIGRI